MPEIVMLDGGLGQEIYKRAGKPRTPLWASKVMMEQPALVQAVHEAFIAAGAQVLTLNTYTATPTRLVRDGQGAWFEPLQDQAYELAARARDQQGKPEVALAACLPPLIGSYTQDKRSQDELQAEYRKIVALQAPRVDLFLIETISAIREAVAAVQAALERKKPVLLSLTLSDQAPGYLRSGEKVVDAVTQLKEYPLAGLLFNCSYPESITRSMPFLRESGLPFGGYANGFTSVEPLKLGGTVDALAARTDMDPQRYGQEVLPWLAQGATYVGGCCEVGPDHISELRRTLQEAGYGLAPGFGAGPSKRAG